MEHYLSRYQSANLTNEESIQHFVVRTKLLKKVLADINRTPKGTSFQHYVFVARRGSGKSTMLRRIEAELCTKPKLKKQYIATNLSEEQAGIYKLYDLWDYVIRDLQAKDIAVEGLDWTLFQDDMKSYTKALYAELLACLKREKKRLILLIDNIDRIFKNIGSDAALLREQLMNHNDVRIIGGSTVMSEQYWKYDMPFYQFFSIERLGPLTIEEVKLLLHHWAEQRNAPEIKEFAEKHPGKIQAVRILTDGTPRSMLLFVNMVIDRNQQHGFEYLRAIVDHATPVFQERLLNLSPQQQKIVTELSFFWEAVGVDALMPVCKMPGKVISAALNQLAKDGIVEKVKGEKKNLFYRLEERFFNLWLLMTQGGPKQKREVKYLTVFLENWYDADELRAVYHEVVESMQSGAAKPSYAVAMTKALAHSKWLSVDQRDSIIEQALQLEGVDPAELEHLPEKAQDLFVRAHKLINAGKTQQAVDCLHSIEQEHHLKSVFLGVGYKLQGRPQEAEQSFKLALKHDKVVGSALLGVHYYDLGKLIQAKPLLKIGADNGEHVCQTRIGQILVDEGNLDEAERYLKMATSQDFPLAFRPLFEIYLTRGDIAVAEQLANDALKLGLGYPASTLANYFYFEMVDASQALKWASNAVKADPEAVNSIVLLSIIQLWVGDLDAHITLRKELFRKSDEISSEWLSYYLYHLLVHEQAQFVFSLFDSASANGIDKKENLVSYFTTLKLLAPQDAELERMPPELAETVAELVAEIKEDRVRFYLAEK